MSSRSTFEKSLRTAARNVPNESVPETLSAKVQNALPGKAPTRPAAKWVPRLAVAGAIAGVAIAGGYFLPRTVITTSYAASMKQAIANAQTWHFTGWRLVKGKRVRWEVWGRRSPFLYREQVGGELLIDDGKRRVHILPPDDYTGSPGTCLITPNEPLLSMNTPDISNRIASSGHSVSIASVTGCQVNAGFLAGIGSENSKFNYFESTADNSSKLKAQNVNDIGTDPPIRERTSLWIDGKTFLPTRYTLVQETHKKTSDGSLDVPLDAVPEKVTTLSELIPEYNTPVSETLTQYVLPAGYKIIDATKTQNGQALDGAVCTRKGLTLKAHVVGKDGEGNVHLRFEGWLAGEPIRYRIQGLSLRIQTKDGSRAVMENPETSRNYVETNQPPWIPTNAEQPEIWLTPLEPFIQGEAPRTLHLVVDADLSRYERVSNTGRAITVLADKFEFDISLPNKSMPLGWDETPTTPEVIYSDVRPTYLLRKAEVRSYYYRNRTYATTFIYPDGHQEVVSDGAYNRRRARFWLGIVEQEAKRTHNETMLEMVQKNRESLEELNKR